VTAVFEPFAPRIAECRAIPRHLKARLPFPILPPGPSELGVPRSHLKASSSSLHYRGRTKARDSIDRHALLRKRKADIYTSSGMLSPPSPFALAIMTRAMPAVKKCLNLFLMDRVIVRSTRPIRSSARARSIFPINNNRLPFLRSSANFHRLTSAQRVLDEYSTNEYSVCRRNF